MDNLPGPLVMLAVLRTSMVIHEGTSRLHQRIPIFFKGAGMHDKTWTESKSVPTCKWRTVVFSPVAKQLAYHHAHGHITPLPPLTIGIYLFVLVCSLAYPQCRSTSVKTQKEKSPIRSPKMINQKIFLSHIFRRTPSPSAKIIIVITNTIVNAINLTIIVPIVLVLVIGIVIVTLIVIVIVIVIVI